MKRKVLSLLKQNNDVFISGEDISRELGISRSAVWKHVNSLRQAGYKIESMPKNGYKLIYSPDILTLEEIQEHLTTSFIGRNVYYYDTLSSTNVKAKELAMIVEEGTIIISEEQTEGRGRLGRQWVSPRGKGIWLSIILKPNRIPSEVAKLTLIGAAAVNLGLKDIGIESSIKWPNDILIHDKKLCGILTEMSCELNRINYVIMGIGVNVNIEVDDIDKELKRKITSLANHVSSIDRKKLSASILNRLEELYIPFKERGDISRAVHISRQNSLLIGKEIRIIRGDKENTAMALDIEDDGRLLIMHQNGEKERIYSGEISVRGLNGYI